MKHYLGVLFFFLAVNGSFGQSAKENAVWARVDALNKAIFEAKDSVALKDLVSSHVTYGHSGGNLEDKATMIYKAATSPTTYKNPSTERLSIFFVNETAILRHIFRATSVEKEVESPLNLSILQVWASENGKWRIVARQAVKVNPK